MSHVYSTDDPDSMHSEARGNAWLVKELATLPHNAVAKDGTSLNSTIGNTRFEYGTQLNVNHHKKVAGKERHTRDQVAAQS